MDNEVIVEKMKVALASVAGDAHAFMNQYDISAENVIVINFHYVEKAVERLMKLSDDDDGSELVVILQVLAAASFSTGFLLGYQFANDRKS